MGDTPPGSEDPVDIQVEADPDIGTLIHIQAMQAGIFADSERAIIPRHVLITLAKQRHIHTARIGDELKGLAIVLGGTPTYLHLLGVVRQYRGLGIGTALLTSVMTETAKHRSELKTTFHPSLRKFYTKDSLPYESVNIERKDERYEGEDNRLVATYTLTTA